MTREEITRMWEKANGWSPAELDETVKELARFADLIVAAERQRKAWDATYWTAYEHDVAAAEREACAKLFDKYNHRVSPSEMAKVIRARGQAKLKEKNT